MRHGLFFAALSVALLSLVSGCAHSTLRSTLSCPHRSGPQWVEYTSRHFVVVTNLPPAQARALVYDFEQTYSSFVDITGWHFPGREEPPGRMKLIVFEREADYAELAPRYTDGFFAPDTVDGVPVVVLTAAGSQSSRVVFLHELTHRLLRYYVAKAPLWLHEGLAEFYSTFYLENDAARFGAVPRRMAVMRAVPLPPAWMLFSVESFDGRNVSTSRRSTPGHG